MLIICSSIIVQGFFLSSEMFAECVQHHLQPKIGIVQYFYMVPDAHRGNHDTLENKQVQFLSSYLKNAV